jgi:cell division protein FtsA
LSNAITAIEPGTTKLVVLIGRSNQDGMLELSGLGNARYEGVQGEGWQSGEMLSRSLNDAVGQAQKMAGIRISSCTLGVPNEFCGLIRSKKEISPGRPVTKQDVMELRRMVSSYSLPSPWKVSNVVYGSFLVDGVSIGNPLGMICDRLGLEASLICIHNDFVQQFTRVLSSMRIRVNRAVPVPLACGEVFLTREEKQNGAVWIDVGGHSTDIAVYQNGMPVLFDWLPIGGDTITQDIVTGTGATREEAEKLKRYCVLGLALHSETEASAMDMPVHAGKTIHNIPLELLQEIVEARIEELLEIVLDKIQSEGLLPGCRTVVLAGGGISLLRGIREFSSRVLGIPVRLGVPDVIGLSSPVLSAAYSLGNSTLDGGASGNLSVWVVLRAMLRKFRQRFKFSL